MLENSEIILILMKRGSIWVNGMSNNLYSYSGAIREAHRDTLNNFPTMKIFGQGLWSPFYVGSTLNDLDQEFGKHRVIDTPVSENAVTAAAFGYCLQGGPACVVHPRVDFGILATDTIFNTISKWRYVLASEKPISLLIRMIINRGGEQGAQHAQSLQSIFAHCPGLNVVYPSTPKAVYAEIMEAAAGNRITILFEDRALYDVEEVFDKSNYEVNLDEIRVNECSADKLIISYGQVANLIENVFKDCPISTYSLTNLSKVNWTRLCSVAAKYPEILICEDAWANCSFSSEILANLMLNGVQSRARRLSLPAIPAPTHREYERQYFIGVDVLEKFINGS